MTQDSSGQSKGSQTPRKEAGPRPVPGAGERLQRLQPRQTAAQGYFTGRFTDSAPIPHGARKVSDPISEARQLKQPATQHSGVWTPTSGPPGLCPDSSAGLSAPEPASALACRCPSRFLDALASVPAHGGALPDGATQYLVLSREPRAQDLQRRGKAWGAEAQPLAPQSHTSPTHTHTQDRRRYSVAQ